VRSRPVAQQIEALGPDRDAVGERVCLRRLDRLGLVVHPEHRLPAELRCRDREHARATAEVDEAVTGLQLDEQLQAQARRVMRARAERLARVDHDLVHARAHRRLLPRRAHV
jgi:hypothetical protein